MVVAAARAEENGDVETLLFESGCCVRLFVSKVLLRHGDAMVGSLE